jgi:uncharacterized protein YegP (UPF0339 family)
MEPKITVFESNDQWYWHLTAGNGEIIAQGEAHTRKEDAERAAANVIRIAKEMPDDE